MIRRGNEKNNVLMVTDLDEVLTLIGPPWYERLRGSRVIERYFGTLQELSPQQVCSRERYYISEWLGRGSAVPLDVREEIMSVYTDPTFYERCELTAFGRAVDALAAMPFCEKIHIVSRTIPGTEQAKADFVERNFRNAHLINLVMVHPSTPKSHFVKDVDWTVFIDDSPSEVIDIVTNTDSVGKEIMIPRMGYNYPTPGRLAELTESLSLQLCYYSVFEEPEEGG